MVQVGVAVPLAAEMLAQAGIAQTTTPPAYSPAKRGGGGALKLLYWQGATLLNPHFATGTKDLDATRLFYEPLASWDPDGNLVPILAAEIPSLTNGGVAPDGKSVVWKLKPNVQWHDGKPFTSADVVFNWVYAANPDTAAVTIAEFKDTKVTALDPLTVRLDFEKPRAFWAEAFVSRGLIPKHVFENYTGSKSREAPANLKPVGTGPYRLTSFTPGDLVRASLNPNYHQPNRPYFDTVEIKGGGDAVSAARAVLQTAEYDYAWNLQVEDEILTRMEKAGKGKVQLVAGGALEFVAVQMADPWTEVEGERSNPKTKHPILSDPLVRSALNLLLDRSAISQFVYGRTGPATANVVDNPVRFRSKNTKIVYDVDQANRLLDQAGWKRGQDGVRVKDGRRLKLVLNTTVNQPRQKTQAIYKQSCQKAGIELELKATTGSVFFSADEGNPDTADKFYCDLEMFTVMVGPDPGSTMQAFCSWEVAAKANKWQRRNIGRWRNEEYDALYLASDVELDPVKRAELIIKMNDLIVQHHVILPIVARPMVNASNNRLQFVESGWDSSLAFIADWHRGA
jgi:peptide/nickel transport system substrate-binding protein